MAQEVNSCYISCLVQNVWPPAQVVQISFRRKGLGKSLAWSLFIDQRYTLTINSIIMSPLR